jgi:hypothetical protein
MPLAGEKTRPLALPTACDGMVPVGHLSRPDRPWCWYVISPFTEEERTVYVISSDLGPFWIRHEQYCPVIPE